MGNWNTKDDYDDYNAPDSAGVDRLVVAVTAPTVTVTAALWSRVSCPICSATCSLTCMTGSCSISVQAILSTR